MDISTIKSKNSKPLAIKNAELIPDFSLLKIKRPMKSRINVPTKEKNDAKKKGNCHQPDKPISWSLLVVMVIEGILSIRQPMGVIKGTVKGPAKRIIPAKAHTCWNSINHQNSARLDRPLTWKYFWNPNSTAFWKLILGRDCNWSGAKLISLNFVVEPQFLQKRAMSGIPHPHWSQNMGLLENKK
jgi:hypothetical protein